MNKKIFIIATLLIIFIAGCTQKYPKIARVGKNIININDFKAMLSPNNYEVFKKLNPQQQYNVAKQLIMQAIDHKALYALALENGIKIVKNEQYNKFKDNWMKTRKDFYLKIGISETELRRIFNEYYMQKIYLDKIKNSITYTESDLKNFYETYKTLYFTIQPHIKGNEIIIDLQSMSIDKQNELLDKLQQQIEKVKGNYELFKTYLKTNLGDSVRFKENAIININFLKSLFSDSPDEYKNILNLKLNSFSDIYTIKNKYIIFYVKAVQKEKKIQEYADVKDKVIKYYIENKLTQLGEKKVEKYKSTHKIEIYVENPFALLQ